MNKKTAISFGLWIVVAIVMGMWGSLGSTANGKDVMAEEPTEAISEKSEAKDSLERRTDSVDAPKLVEHQVVAYYFHGNVRCASCRKIEAYTKEAIDSAFGDALKCGSLEWRVINTDSSQHEHYLKDYQLYTRSVVISDIHKGKETRWKNLEKVWELLGDQEEFSAYITNEVRLFMDATK